MFVRLNPNYWLRQDGNRVILLGEKNDNWESQEWLSFIHPYHAIMFSFFKGELPFEKELENCATFFNLPINRTRQIVSQYLNNPNSIKIRQKDGETIGFPKNVLLSSYSKFDNLLNTAKYSTSDFEINGTPDYNRLRLQFPININFELTMKCYADCCYCYANRQLRDRAMVSFDVIKNLIKEAKDNRAYKFDINGGEVLLHPNIKEILSELTRNGYMPLVSTKMPINHDMLNHLKDVGLKKFQISLDSIDENILKKMICVPSGYLEKIYNTINYAQSIGLEIEVNTVITRYNSESHILEQLIEKLSGFKNIHTLRLSPYGYSIYKKNFNELSPSKNQLQLIESTYHEWSKKYSLDIRFSSYEDANSYIPENRTKIFNRRAICTGNVWGVVILPNGDVTICEELYDHPAFILGNINRNSLKEIWNSPKAIELYENPLKNISSSRCKNCNSYNECRTGAGVCWKTVIMAYGEDNWHYPDPRCPNAPEFINNFCY